MIELTVTNIDLVDWEKITCVTFFDYDLALAGTSKSRIFRYDPGKEKWILVEDRKATNEGIISISYKSYLTGGTIIARTTNGKTLISTDRGYKWGREKNSIQQKTSYRLFQMGFTEQDAVPFQAIMTALE